jgi:RNA polymerase sigma-70 factor, ECF subfamily
MTREKSGCEDRSSDVEAYDRLVREEYLCVYRFLFWLHPVRSTAEDLTQETFIRAWHGLGSRRGTGQRAWLLAIARRVWLDHRRKRCLPTVSLGEAVEIPRDERPLEDRIADDDQRARLQAAVLELPEPYRSAIVLTKIEGLETWEAARALSVPQGTVKWRVSRGLRLLRERLGAVPASLTVEVLQDA